MPRAQFFIYGGLAMHADAVGALHSAIAKIRVEAGVKDADTLKFNTSTRPNM